MHALPAATWPPTALGRTCLNPARVAPCRTCRRTDHPNGDCPRYRVDERFQTRLLLAAVVRMVIEPVAQKERTADRRGPRWIRRPASR